MTDKEKDPCNCAEHHDHDACNCGEDTEASDTLTFEMEDGTTKDFHILEIIEHEGNKYIALAEPDNEEYYVMLMEESEENLEFSFIEDDDLYGAVVAKFEEIFDLYDSETEE